MLPRSLLFAAVTALVFSPRLARSSDDNDQFREDVILCDEALAHLETCCPHTSFSIECRYSFEDGGCYEGSQTELPSFGVGESQCFISLDCAAIQAGGVCADPTTWRRVCP